MAARNGKKNGSNRTRINTDIKVSEVRVINQSGDMLGVMSTRDALREAQDADLDLVEVSPNADPPVCRIMDFGKYKFELDKKQSKARKKQKEVKIKEIKFRPGTEEGDYQVKLRNIVKFLNNGDKVKITMRFRGREIAHFTIGEKLLERLEQDIQEVGSVEQTAKREGKQIVMVIGPKRN